MTWQQQACAHVQNWKKEMAKKCWKFVCINTMSITFWSQAPDHSCLLAPGSFGLLLPWAPKETHFSFVTCAKGLWFCKETVDLEFGKQQASFQDSDDTPMVCMTSANGVCAIVVHTKWASHDRKFSFCFLIVLNDNIAKEETVTCAHFLSFLFEPDCVTNGKHQNVKFVWLFNQACSEICFSQDLVADCPAIAWSLPGNCTWSLCFETNHWFPLAMPIVAHRVTAQTISSDCPKSPITRSKWQLPNQWSATELIVNVSKQHCWLFDFSDWANHTKVQFCTTIALMMTWFTATLVSLETEMWLLLPSVLSDRSVLCFCDFLTCSTLEIFKLGFFGKFQRLIAGKNVSTFQKKENHMVLGQTAFTCCPVEHGRALKILHLTAKILNLQHTSKWNWRKHELAQLLVLMNDQHTVIETFLKSISTGFPMIACLHCMPLALNPLLIMWHHSYLTYFVPWHHHFLMQQHNASDCLKAGQECQQQTHLFTLEDLVCWGQDQIACGIQIAKEVLDQAVMMKEIVHFTRTAEIVEIVISVAKVLSKWYFTLFVECEELSNLLTRGNVHQHCSLSFVDHFWWMNVNVISPQRLLAWAGNWASTFKKFDKLSWVTCSFPK